jgi:hypothetical protein
MHTTFTNGNINITDSIHAEQREKQVLINYSTMQQTAQYL